MDYPNKIAVSTLDQTSSEYRDYWREWRDLDLLHEGGIRLKDSVGFETTSLLVKRPKEPNDVYAARVARFTYQPILPVVISWYSSKLFEKQPSITGIEGDFWAQFQLDADRAGGNLTSVASDIFETAFLYSTAYVLTDLPSTDGAFESLADQQRAKVLDPYLTVYSPLSITNYKVDRYGMLEWIIIKTVTLQQDFNSKARSVTEWRIFDTSGFAVYESVADGESVGIGGPMGPAMTTPMAQDATLVRSGQHALAKAGRVPVRRITLRKPHRLARRAYSQLLDHLNQDNTYGWALFNANLAMPYFIGAGDMTPTLSEVGWFSLPAGASAGWLEPSGQTFEYAQKRLDSLRQEIYRSFHLQAQGRDSTATAAASSGYSKELDMAPAQDMMDGFGEFMRDTLQHVLEDVAEAHAEDPSKIAVAWARYDSRMTLEEIVAGEALDTIDIQSDSLYKARDKRVAMRYLEDEPQELKDAVADEIETAPGKQERADLERQQQMQQFQQSLTTATDRSFSKETVKQESAAAA